jgi:transposase
MMLYEASHRNARFAHLLAGAKRPVQHPFCNLNDFARPYLYPYDPTASPILATFVPKPTTVKWIPSIMKLYYLSDIGRMNPLL